MIICAVVRVVIVIKNSFYPNTWENNFIQVCMKRIYLKYNILHKNTEGILMQQA